MGACFRPQCLTDSILKRFFQHLTARYKALSSGSLASRKGPSSTPVPCLSGGRDPSRSAAGVRSTGACSSSHTVAPSASATNCSINPGCILYGHGGLDIGSNVRIAAYTVIVPANHVFEQQDKLIREQGLTMKGVKIGDDVWLGTRVTVTDGVEIAQGCVIGAGAVVTESTEPYGVYVGVPARLVKFRGEA